MCIDKLDLVRHLSSVYLCRTVNSGRRVLEEYGSKVKLAHEDKFDPDFRLG